MTAMPAACWSALSTACLMIASVSAQAQFTLPLPAPPPASAVFQEDMQMLFVDWNDRGTYAWSPRLEKLRARAASARANPDSARVLAADANAFCRQERVPIAACTAALHPDTLLARLGRDGASAHPPTQVFIRFPLEARPRLARYLRHSGADGGLTIVPQFAANVSDEEAYVVTSLVRGLMGRFIFSADQAMVVARSEDPEPAVRRALESDKATLLRAVNNGGTLVARLTLPFFAASGATASRAVGMTASAGLIGPVTESADNGGGSRRYAAGSTALEALASFPVRGLSGTSEVLADFVVGGRAGYTYSAGALRTSGGFQDVSFGQIVLGLRQNGAISVSALVTFANHGFDDLVPRLGLNLAATR